MNVMCQYTRMASTSGLIENPQNPQKHPQKQIELLAEILEHQGWRSPIVVSKRSGFIVKGHARLMAAKLNGWVEVPIDEQDYPSEAMEWADMIADNKIQELSESDDEQIQKLALDMGPDFEFKLLGIPDFKIIGVDTLPPDDEDTVPNEPAQATNKIGDRWELGEHVLMCGDSKKDVVALTGGQEFDLLFTDPPYGISVVSNNKNGYGTKGQYDKKASCGIYDSITGDDEPFDPGYLLSIGKNQIIWGANNFASKLPDNSHWLVWLKNMPAGTNFSGAELAWTSIKKKAVKVYEFTWAGMTRAGSREDELTKRVHPTQKPVGLFVNILDDYSPASVLDLYGGSGSTLIACEKTNRKCYMMEIEPLYCDVIITRWERFTGKKAKHVETGLGYEELGRQRL